jgi:hypothetical protein
VRWIWNSATITTWGSQAVGPIRLLIVTPLLVTRFSQEELSSWYLFGSAAGFSGLLAGRVAQAFSQMISFGMAGARDVRPVTGAPSAPVADEPNWPLVERVFASMGSINLVLSLATVAVSGLLSWWGLIAVLEQANPRVAQDVWWAFGLYNLGVLVELLCRQYAIALRGAGHVALANRGDIAINLLSVTGSFVALWLGAGILVLMAVNQGIATLGQARFWYLIRGVEEGRFARFRKLGYDPEIVASGLRPAWRAFLQAFGTIGALRLSGVMIARVADVAVSSSYLFTLNVMFALAQYAETPFRSQAPSWGKDLISGDERLVKSVRSRSRMSLALLAAALLALAPAGTALLAWSRAQTPLLAGELGVLMGLVFLVRSAYGLAFGVGAIGNHIFCYNEQVAAGLLSCAVILLGARDGGVVCVLLALLVPQIVLLRVLPLRAAEAMLGLPRATMIRDLALPMSIYLLGAAALRALNLV